jgi:hypothetical protein
LKEFLELLNLTGQEFSIEGLKFANFIKIFSERLSQGNNVDNISDFLYLTEKRLNIIEDIISTKIEDVEESKRVQNIMPIPKTRKSYESQI